jgi:hypothetical protein
MIQKNPESLFNKKLTRREVLKGATQIGLSALFVKVFTGCGASDTNIELSEAKTEEKSYEPYTIQPGDGWLKVLSQWDINIQLITTESGKRWSLSDQQLAEATVVAMKDDPQQPGRTIKESEATLSQAINGGMPLVPGLTLYLGDSEIPEASTIREIQAQLTTYIVKEGDSINSLAQQYLREQKLTESNLANKVGVTIESQNSSVINELTLAELNSLPSEQTNIWPGDKIIFTSPYPVQE